MLSLTLNDLKCYLQEYVPAILDWNNRSLHKTEEESRFEAYTEIVATQALEPLLAEYVNELREIIKRVNSLDCTEVQNWCFKTKDLYKDRLFGFELEYLYSTDSIDDPIVYKRLGFTVPSTDFKNLIQFCKVQGILYWGEYYKQSYERTKPETEGYYYVPQAHNTPSKIDIIRSMLSAF
ncbi:MAG TPA: hypothetical protein VK167_04260 [Flavipsychrobacter sp.]|nr:hypothetical protein [Flavipsychrobacter sp.]